MRRAASRPPRRRRSRASTPAPATRRGSAIFPGFLPGAEEGDGGWSAWITGSAPGKGLLFGFGNGFFANMVYEKPDWSYKTASLDSALAAAVEKTGRVLDAVDPDLSKFEARGGKLILYHGWNDPAISALNSVDYYESVVRAMGRDRAAAFLRLYLLPGVQHCGDGPGPSSFDPQASGSPPRLVPRAAELGGKRLRARRHRRDEVRGRSGRGARARQGADDAAALSLSRACGVPRPGRHERRRELRVRDEVTRQGLPAAFAAGAAAGLPIAKTLCIPRT